MVTIDAIVANINFTTASVINHGTCPIAEQVGLSKNHNIFKKKAAILGLEYYLISNLIFFAANLAWQ